MGTVSCSESQRVPSTTWRKFCPVWCVCVCVRVCVCEGAPPLSPVTGPVG